MAHVWEEGRKCVCDALTSPNGSFLISCHFLLIPGGFYHSHFTVKEREACGEYRVQTQWVLSRVRTQAWAEGPLYHLVKVMSISQICLFSPSSPWTDCHYFLPRQLQEFSCWAPHFHFLPPWILAVEWPARYSSNRIRTLSLGSSETLCGFHHCGYGNPSPSALPDPVAGLHSFFHVSTDSCHVGHHFSGAPAPLWLVVTLCQECSSPRFIHG